MQRVIDTRPVPLANPPAYHEAGGLFQSWAAASLVKAGTPPEFLCAQVCRDSQWVTLKAPSRRVLANAALDHMGANQAYATEEESRATPVTIRCPQQAPVYNATVTRRWPIEYFATQRELARLRRHRLILGVACGLLVVSTVLASVA